MHPSRFYAVVSGADRTAAAAVARSVLRVAELPYAAAMRWRNYRFEQGQTAIHRVHVPVISVGNLTLGGTGKTPLVAWLAGLLARRGIRVTILSRGYGNDAGDGNDERRELRQRLPEVAHLQHPNRVRAAQRAIREQQSQLLLLDDGFQHRRLGRDLDIVLLDAHSPFGYGHVFPRGTLREPLSGLSRADAVCLTRADQIEPSAREAVRTEVARLAPHAVWCELVHAPRRLLNAAGEQQPCDALRGQRIAAFCGIGNPTGFATTLRDPCGYQLVAFREHADHHAYADRDLAELATWAQELDVSTLVCTHKDLVKIGKQRIGTLPLWALQVEMECPTGEAALVGLINDLLQRYQLPTVSASGDSDSIVSR